MNCKNCNKEMDKKQIFCSRKCSASFNNKTNPKRKLEGTCSVCHTPVKSSCKYCTRCYREVYIKIKLKEPRKTIPDRKICNVCHIEYPIENFNKNSTGRYYRPSCRDCFNRMTKDRQNAIKQKSVDYKGGKCSICGYSKCLTALEFHHLDPKEKDINISKINSIDLSKYISELDKCVLLCSNCHREIHFN